jgi:hypothetical protein
MSFVLHRALCDGCESGPSQPDFLFETSCSFSNLPWPTRRHYIGAVVQTGLPKMAVYSLTGKDSSPFHAEPSQPSFSRRTRSSGLMRGLGCRGCQPSWPYLELALFMQSLMKDLRSLPVRFFLSARLLQAFILSD